MAGFENTRRNREFRKFGPLVHGGFMFHSSGKQTGLANAASAVFLMDAPAGVFPHIQRVELNVGSGGIDLIMRENVVTSADGTPLPVLNVNRNSATVPGALIYGTPTITDAGDDFHTIWIPDTGAGVGSSTGVMDVDQGEEWVLAENVKYSFTITNNSGGAVDFSYEFVWYEVGFTDLPV
jgi:hypothetical protein